MRIGVPKEIKDYEFRVGLTPELVRVLTKQGHQVVVQTGAGARIGYTDESYLQAGGQISQTAAQVYECELVVKVKEPLPQEFTYLREGQILFGFFHLAAEPRLAEALVEKKVVAIACETVTDSQGRLPLLLPMSEIAGRVGVQAAATTLHLDQGGRGVLLGGVPGVPPAKVVVLGGGVAGAEAVKIALGMGADVTVLDHNLDRLRRLQEIFGIALKTRYSTESAIEEEVEPADVLIAAVLIPGRRAPHLIGQSLVRRMARGAVIVDIAIDQGGCCETSVPTSHSHPTYIVEGVVHYCVTNMPGACARTATQALNNALFPYVVALANKGYRGALSEDVHFRDGLNVCLGAVTNRAVAEDLGYPYFEAAHFL
jgi:alanine dehydrogenase